MKTSDEFVINLFENNFLLSTFSTLNPLLQHEQGSIFSIDVQFLAKGRKGHQCKRLHPKGQDPLNWEMMPKLTASDKDAF